jgi:hypothetical protein
MVRIMCLVSKWKAITAETQFHESALILDETNGQRIKDRGKFPTGWIFCNA